MLYPEIAPLSYIWLGVSGVHLKVFTHDFLFKLVGVRPLTSRRLCLHLALDLCGHIVSKYFYFETIIFLESGHAEGERQVF